MYHRTREQLEEATTEVLKETQRLCHSSFFLALAIVLVAILLRPVWLAILVGSIVVIGEATMVHRTGLRRIVSLILGEDL